MNPTRLAPRPAALWALLVASLLSGGPAQAIPLPFNVITELPGTTVGLEPQLAGVILEDHLQAFEFETEFGRIRGQLQSRVVRSTLDGTLDFYWRVFNDEDSAASLRMFRVRNFIAPEAPDGLRSDWRIDGLGDMAPDRAQAVNPNLFLYVFHDDTANDPFLRPGMSSKLFFLDTQATHYAMTAELDVSRIKFEEYSGSGFLPTFAPAVPEPCTWALMTLGLAPMLWRGRRSKRT
jgi:hypothetical protein